MSRTIECTTVQLRFQEGGDTKVSIESDGASTLKFYGDDGSEIGFVKNVTLIRNHAITSSSPYSVPVTVDRVGIRNTGETNPFIVNLPALAFSLAGRTFRFKDETGNCGSFPIHIRPNGSDTLDGSTNDYVLNVNYSAVTIYCDSLGAAWFVE